MPATVRSTGIGNTGSASSATFSPSMPAGFAVGDLLIGIAVNGGGDVPSARPSGTTAVTNVDDGTVCNLDVVRKVAVGGDVFTWTAPSVRKWSGCVIAITVGTFNTTTPVQGNVGAPHGTTAGTTYTTPTATPGNADSLIIAAFGAQTASTWSTSNINPSMTEVCDTTSTGIAAASCGVYRSNTAPAVASISRSATATVSSANACMFMMFVNPSAAAPAVLLRPRRRGPNYRR